MSETIKLPKSGPNGETLGRTVHMVDADSGEVHVAIVIATSPKSDPTLAVLIDVLRQDGTVPMMRAEAVPFSRTYRRGHWSWPPRT